MSDSMTCVAVRVFGGGPDGTGTTLLLEVDDRTVQTFRAGAGVIHSSASPIEGVAAFNDALQEILRDGHAPIAEADRAPMSLWSFERACARYAPGCHLLNPPARGLCEELFA